MFVLDSSFPGIQAFEPEVEAVYRSQLPVAIPLEGLAPVVCECFVCLVRREETRRVHLALYIKESRKCLVYVPDGSLPAGVDGEDKLPAAALELARALGFVMEGVNLNYGTALREVMVRSLPVVLSPEAFRKALVHRAGGERDQTREGREKDRAEALIRARVEALGLVVEKIRFGLAASRESTAAGQAAAREEEERLAAEKEAAEKRFAILQKEQERLAAEKAGAEKRTSDLSRSVRLAEERLAAERRERERLAAEKKEAERLAAELARRVRLGEERLAAERSEREKLRVAKTGSERLAAEKAAAEARASELAESVRLAEERLLEERTERERLDAEKSLAERQLRELGRAVQLAEEKTAAERTERERLEADRAQWERLAREKSLVEKRVQELTEAVGVAEAKMAEERSEKERLVAERHHGERLEAEKREVESKLEELLASYREAVGKFEAERSERERLAAEKSMAESQLKDLSKALRSTREKALEAPAARAQVERLLAAKAGAETRAEELTQALRLARERAEFERRERERLAAEKSLAEKRLADVTARMERGQEKGSGEMEETRGLPRLDWLTGARDRQASRGGPPPGGCSRPSFPGASFLVDWNLPIVGYSDADEVVEVYQSIGPSQLSLEGFPSQYFSAFIIGLKKGGLPRVYVTFFLHADHRALVYVPSRDPVGPSGYAKARKEAMQFLQLAGYMLDRVSLGTNRESRARVLDNIPVLARPASNVEGF